MARYIDADALIKGGWHLERSGVSNRTLQVMSIADVPTADVAPKSEVAREIFEEIKKAIKEETLDYCNGFEKAETLELQEYFKTKQNTAIFLYMKIDNLEKKYTEEKE